MSGTLLGLCLPTYNEETSKLFENNDIFDEENTGIFSDENMVRSSLVLGRDGLGSEVTNHLVMQAAVSASYLGRRVLVILAAGKWTGWPSGVHRMPVNDALLTKNMRFFYPTSLQDLVEFASDTLETENVPDTVIIQGVDILLSTQDPKVSNKYKLIKLLSVLTDFIAQKFLPSNPLDNSHSSDTVDGHDKTIIENDSIESKSVSSLDDTSEDDHNKANTSVINLNEDNIERDGCDTNATFPEIETAVAVTHDESLTKEYKVKHLDQSDINTSDVKEMKGNDTLVKENVELETVDNLDANKDLSQRREVKVDSTVKSEMDASATDIEELKADENVQEKEELETVDNSDTAKDKPPASELLIFGDIPNLFEDSRSLGQFFSEMWHFKSKGGVNFDLDLVCPQHHNVSIKYTLAEDSYHLESIKIKEK